LPIFSFYSSPNPPHLHPFPTRRSSDLTAPFLERAAATSNAQDLGRLLQDALDHVSYSVGRESQAVLSVHRLVPELNQKDAAASLDRKSTRLNSSHVSISYAVFCLKKKT